MEDKELDIDDLGIFQNQDDVADNLKKAAESLGVDVNEDVIDRLKDGQPIEVAFAKKNCKWCHGKGTVKFAPNKQGRNTSRPEAFKDAEWHKDNMVVAYCKCVRRRLE